MYINEIHILWYVFVGIIGLFGSGKTTLMNIISGLYEVEEKKVS